MSYIDKAMNVSKDHSQKICDLPISVAKQQALIKDVDTIIHYYIVNLKEISKLTE